MRRNDTGLFRQRVPMRPDLALTADEARHTQRVREYLAAEIVRAGGWIDFERYMDIALYAPGLGYYSAGAHKLGQGGDFTTAPEISRLFGACVAQQCADVLQPMAQGSILEIGAGSGRLAVDVLSRLETLGALPECYRILEISADLRDRQRRAISGAIPHLLERIEWIEAPSKTQFDGVILANEVLDALPVVRFRWHPTYCEELGVATERGRFIWAPRPASATTSAVCDALEAAGGGWQDGYESEYSPRLGTWTREVTRALRSGLVLWVDYGLPRAQYYFPERRDGTLLCHFRQRAFDDPFLHPGLQDITAWVDFTWLAESCMAAGCELAGFTTQAHFLAGLGIDREMRSLAGRDEHAYARRANEARQLMLPGQMGERFKAMAWVRGIDASLRGFGLNDLRHTL